MEMDLADGVDLPAGHASSIGDISISKDRVWIDGCFDFVHHGHAGAMLQAKRLGKKLIVGVHSDEAILQHKGPTVMDLRERISAVDACRWSNLSVPNAPYVTSLPWVSRYGCHYVVHGDDITSDSNGQDCYRFVKAAGRFLVVTRTSGISTTDLVGRMLLCTKTHLITSFKEFLLGSENLVGTGETGKSGRLIKQMIKDYATDESGLGPGSQVLACNDVPNEVQLRKASDPGLFDLVADGKAPQPGQRVVYVDGAFDLFSSGHIEFLKQVYIKEQAISRRSCLQKEYGETCESAYIVAGIHDDAIINQMKGGNYPIMNIFERSLCVLQCRYINSIVISAPYVPTAFYLENLPYGTPDAVYHRSTTAMPPQRDPYLDAKRLGLYQEITSHDYQEVDAEQIVHRIMANRILYEERQKAKMTKLVAEQAVKHQELHELTSDKPDTCCARSTSA